MFVSLVRGALVVMLLATGSAACDRNSQAPVTPTTPPAVEITEPPFTGTLTINGGSTVPFVATNVGIVSAILTTLEPNRADFSLSIGVGLGTWNGTSCQVNLFNDNTGIGSGIAGYANGPGNLCARVYDAGQLTEPVTFAVTIKHY